MRRAPPLLLLLLLAAVAADEPPQVAASESIDTLISNDTIVVDNKNGTLVLRDVNGTVIELDGSPEEVVRKKRTFGDIVFRGLADVLGYSVARKPPQAAFPPPLPPVPGIDTPLAGPAPPPAPAPAPAAATAPCGQPRAAGPPPCRAQKPPPPPQPKAVPPCPKPRAAPRPKPKPKPTTPPPPPPPPPPCAQPRANPATPAPCAPSPPPPKQADNLERITSNLRLNFNFNRGVITPVTPAPAAEAVAAEEAEPESDNQEQFVPIPIEPRAAKLPQTEPRKPRVYVDAFVVRNGVPRRVDTVDAKQLDPQRANADEDYLAYDDDNSQQQLDDDDYEDVQESRDRQAAVHQFGNAVDQFWQHKQQQKRPVQQRAQRLPANHYQNVHFGDRDLADDIRHHSESHQSLQRERPRPNRLPQPVPEAEDDFEATTTTEDPKRPLKPRVLPPTEHNPNQIDTVTVRVPPIYREKRPRKLHRERPEQPDRDEDIEEPRDFSSREQEYEQDTDGDNSSLAPRTERPTKRRRRRKQSRKTRAAGNERYTAGDYDYYGKKVPVSKEEKFYLELTVPPPTLDADVARHEKPVNSGYFLEDHERIREDPSHRIREDPSHRIREDPSHRIREDPSQRIRNEDRSDDSERSEESERVNDEERSSEKERSEEDKERAGEEDRADEEERSDKLSPNARVRESAYKNNYVRATNVQVDDPRPAVASVKRKDVKIGQA